MKLFLISQDENNGYDTYDSAVVAAESEEEAATIIPTTYGPYSNTDWSRASMHGWCSSPDKVSVMYLGEAAEEIEKGTIVASFNSG